MGFVPFLTTCRAFLLQSSIRSTYCTYAVREDSSSGRDLTSRPCLLCHFARGTTSSTSAACRRSMLGTTLHATLACNCILCSARVCIQSGEHERKTVLFSSFFSSPVLFPNELFSPTDWRRRYFFLLNFERRRPQIWNLLTTFCTFLG